MSAPPPTPVKPPAAAATGGGAAGGTCEGAEGREPVRESQCEETEAEVASVASSHLAIPTTPNSNNAHADLTIDRTCTSNKTHPPISSVPLGPGDTPIEAWG